MSFLEYSTGVAWLVSFLGAAAVNGYLIRSLFTPAWSGAPARLVETIGAVSVAVVTAQLSGTIGWFGRPGFLAGMLIVAAGLGYARHRRGDLVGTAPPDKGSTRAGRLLAWLTAGAACFLWTFPVAQSYRAGMYLQDTTWYHMSFSLNFFQSGRTGDLLFTDPFELAAWFYPQNSELLHAVGLVAVRSDFLSPLFNLGWMLLTFLAAWCVGRPFGRGPLIAILVGALLLSELMIGQSGNAPSDLPGIFFLLSCVALIVNGGASKSGAMAGARFGGSALVPAGLAAGLAIGTKVTLLPAVAVISLAVIFFTPRRARLGTSVRWFAAASATGSFWYLRNLIHAGNPFPWIDLGGILPGPDQLPLFPRPPNSVAHYLTSPEVWRDWFMPGFLDSLGPLWTVLLALAVTGMVIGVLRGASPFVRMISLAATASALAYLIIPIGAPGPEGDPLGFQSNLRYLAPALFLALPALALRLKETALPSPLVEIAATALAVTGVFGYSVWSGENVAVAIAATVAFAAIVSAYLLSRSGRVRTLELAAAAAAAFGCVAVVGYQAQDNYLHDRYRYELMRQEDNPGGIPAQEWQPVQDWGRTLRAKKIGVVGPSGAFTQYVFSGSDLSNEIRYVAAPGPNGTFRPIETCSGWRYAINRAGLNFVVITPPEFDLADTEPFESYWLRGEDAVTPIFEVGRTIVYRIAGPLSLEECDTLGPRPRGDAGQAGPGAGALGGLPTGPVFP